MIERMKLSTQRVNELRERRAKLGQVRCEFWLTEAQRAKVKAYVEKITKKPAKSA